VGRIVAAMLTSHAPNITARPEIADAAQRTRFVEALGRVRERLEAARPDLLVAFVNDHLQNFFYDGIPAFALGLAHEYAAPSEGGGRFLRIPPRRLPGAPAWSQALLEAGLAGGFDLAYACELEFWDELSLPAHFLMPERPVPVAPVLTNCVAPPLPPPRRSWALGRFVADFVRGRPGEERVALLGSGGISHWVGTPETGRINADFDRRVLDWIATGQGERLAALGDDEIEAEGGNGGQELRNWIAVLGAAPGVKGEVLAYEAVPEWITGSAVVWLTL
jgi:hypothetical protein